MCDTGLIKCLDKLLQMYQIAPKISGYTREKIVKLTKYFSSCPRKIFLDDTGTLGFIKYLFSLQ